ncbi:uncharacterized protein J7T54_004583 [Emericellopsis cladophorae]|uniref:Carrier domain-containing protein n=1 Tax=Emericellopsis cladophorae TaxID=2686198 RepID=A0A9Q0BFJ1_9HYPO|nr:uncharacterized protein J7T54_004583 [Emericellopsis cladophorae]KAI6784037.1 hypothetical protein J7T54_004583 [Emericellopsis cladophorae]
MAQFLEGGAADILDLPCPPRTNADAFKTARELEPAINSLSNLSQLLTRAAVSSGGLTFYDLVNGELQSAWVSYSQLLADTIENASLLLHHPAIASSAILLLHFDSQRENIIWFWAATFAGHTPAISTPFVNDTTQRRKHLCHLHTLLDRPIVLTSKRLTHEFLGMEELTVHEVESLQNSADRDAGCPTVLSGPEKGPMDIAALMLTSGSTGNAKAVTLRHGQVLAAVEGKHAHHSTAAGSVFLNWVGMDHVASLTEIHLHAMLLGCDQIHVPASELLTQPLQFIHLLDRHKITYTFAPNFFLTKLRDSLTGSAVALTADLRPLKALISGGESNVVATCDELTRQLRQFGAVGDVIRPGFGTCMPGIAMRVTRLSHPGKHADLGEVGELQISGPVVFDRYYNDPKATVDSFTPDGWFITGDLAYLDEAGNLNLTGRTKDTIIVNGAKWSCAQIETAIEEEGIPGRVPTYTVAFPTRKTGSPTEDIAVVYAPAYAPHDHHARFETATSIAKAVALVTSKKPAHLIPLPQSLLEKSSLGKISRTKVRTALENGDYGEFERSDLLALERYRQARWRPAETATEKTVQLTVAELLEMRPEQVNLNSSIFDLGVDSFNLIQLKTRIQKAVEAQIDIPMSVLLTEPTVGAISSAIDTILSQAPAYNPIVPLQPHGSGTPLFCIHPGSGDILVFIALAAHFSTRPVYAIRTRGYNPNERLFDSIQETAHTYAEHIRLTQPVGPYAIAGYSLGSTLAYEVGKVLEAQGQDVKFLASIDYPPHIAEYVQSLNWIDVLLHIAFFLELIDELTMVEITPSMHTLDRRAALSYILDIGDKDRVTALAMDHERLGLISDIAENFRVNVERYEPMGKIKHLDVFVAEPPTYAAKNRQDWRVNKLGRWTELCESEVRFHDCPGIHAKMLNREHVADFAKIFKAAMRRRGV